ncbi:unnamed protein product [Caenorhabditis nigoni]
MQTFQVDEGIERDDSQAKCKEIGTNLTGLASDDETNWIYEQLKEVGVEESLNSYGYWIGAQLPCSNECAIVFSDSYTQSEYIWDNLNFLEEPNGMENCIGVMWTTEYSGPSIYSTWCDTDTANGYVCGYQLK